MDIFFRQKYFFFLKCFAVLNYVLIFVSELRTTKAAAGRYMNPLFVVMSKNDILLIAYYLCQAVFVACLVIAFVGILSILAGTVFFDIYFSAFCFGACGAILSVLVAAIIDGHINY